MCYVRVKHTATGNCCSYGSLCLTAGYRQRERRTGDNLLYKTQDFLPESCSAIANTQPGSV
ncbi:hypothetical protein IQ264_13400 [Phormidium sp. LEGE 05292]|uniref:hypothetical protein n=1 Tax=[Phormidium] sp. LEGE 05292 TaxID=767427 RepID=UPI001880353D|nr:hypothetical protein [Phormidium sp. LEGE 05292]MBE9226419.1 hypothetical protein [Phormidium sp. LEGE 05292]